MRLRDHPRMIRKSGFVNWPPQWRPIGLDKGLVQAERGILADVSRNTLIPNKIFVAMEYQAERYIAVLAFDDEVFANQLYPLLKKNIGRSILQLGELDLAHLH
jgi:hypothetical protein